MTLVAAFLGKIKQVLYGLVVPDSKSPFEIGAGIYTMPFMYLIILAFVALIGYYCWRSYKQEIEEEKLQKEEVAKEKREVVQNVSHSNLTWVNELINWAYMSSESGMPEVVQRWMDDLNITIANRAILKNVKVLIYGIRQGSIPPWVREIGQLQKTQEQIEIPVLLEVQEFGFTISVQEEHNGAVVASTYTAAASLFRCWYTVVISRIEGQGYLAKFDSVLDGQSSVNISFGMKSQSDRKIITTIPEAVANVIRDAVLRTPFYMNLSTWGPLIPTSVKRRKPSSREKKEKTDAMGDTSSPTRQKKKSKRDQSEGSGANSEMQTEPTTPPGKSSLPLPEQDSELRKSNTMPLGTPNTLSERLKSNHGLSGSLGSLVGIKRTPSGRGPAKPIRSREKRIIIKVTDSKGLSMEGTLYCQASLDYPQQKCRTNLAEAGLNRSWPDDELIFDLSAPSSKVKLVFYQNVDGSESAIASASLYLDRIDVNKPSEIALPLRTANKANAEIMLQLDFTENSVESSKFLNPRRSLDLSLLAHELPLTIDEKGDHRSKSLASTVSSFSNETSSASGSKKDVSQNTTVRTTTTKKVSPRSQKSSAARLPPSKSAPDMKRKISSPTLESDVTTCEGSVAETVLKDLSEQAEIARLSPKPLSNIKKGKVTITAISKSDIDGESTLEEQSVSVGRPPTLGGKADEIYYSTHSIHKQIKPEDADSKPEERDGFDEPDSGAVAKTKPKKSRRRTEERPKSLVSGVKAEELPANGEKKEYPKEKTQDDSTLDIPENELQKNGKKKKSRSVTKLFSKLGRKQSVKKSAKASGINEENSSHSGSFATPHPDTSIAADSLLVPSSSGRQNSLAGSEGDSSMSESTSLHSSMNGDKELKRSKSLRKRLFGGKRRTTKN